MQYGNRVVHQYTLIKINSLSFIGMSFVYSVHEILLSFDNLDAVANSKNDDVELMFDITDYKATKEVFVWCEVLIHVPVCFVIKRKSTHYGQLFHQYQPYEHPLGLTSTIEHTKNPTTYGNGHPGPGLGQLQKCGGESDLLMHRD
jgi:hypothetical protein